MAARAGISAANVCHNIRYTGADKHTGVIASASVRIGNCTYGCYFRLDVNKPILLDGPGCLRSYAVRTVSWFTRHLAREISRILESGGFGGYAAGPSGTHILAPGDCVSVRPYALPIDFFALRTVL